MGEIVWASATEHARRCVPIADGRRRRRRCSFCRVNRNTHHGTANGVALTSGCEWCVWQWVRSPFFWRTAARRVR